LGYRLLLVAASLILAILSWRIVETPFRIRRIGKHRSTIFLWTGVGTVSSLACALAIVSNSGFSNRFSEVIIGIDAAKNEALHKNRITNPVTLQDALNGQFPRLGAPHPAPIQLMVWGDSHARSILPAADAIGSERSVGVVTAWHSSTPPVLGYVPDAKFADFSLGKDSPVFNQAVLDHISRNNITTVLLAARWSGYFKTESYPSSTVPKGSFGEALITTVRKIRASGAKPFILMEVPNHKISVPKALLAREVLGTNLGVFACTRECLAEQNRAMQLLVPALTAAGATMIDVSDLLLDQTENRYRMDLAGVALYYDNHHLTRAGALSIRRALATSLLTKER
jgi:hypothetical protein